MTDRTSGATQAIRHASLLALPFVVFHWLVPGVSSLTLGNDYPRYAVPHQLELQYALAHGEFPLFCPGFHEGHTCAALIMGQLFHPLPYLARLWPGYWLGDALTVNTLLRLVELGLVQILLFRLFELLRAPAVAAFVASFVAVYNLRTLDMFRYAIALETHLAFLALCAAVGLFWLERRGVANAVLVTATSYLLGVGGHPQLMYLGALETGVFTALFPFVACSLRSDQAPSARGVLRFYASIAALSAAGFLLAAPLLFPFYAEFMRANATRVGQPYGWSVEFADTWGGALGSFLRPLRSDVHGAFGGSSLLAAVLALPLAVANTRKALAASAVWLAGAALFLVTLGAATPVHRWFWASFPLTSSFRVPGRVGMAIPLLAALALLWMMRRDADAALPPWRRPSLVLGPVAILLVLGFHRWGDGLVPAPSLFTPAHVAHPPAWADPAILWTGIVALVALTALALRPRSSRVPALIFCVTVVAQTMIVLRFGTWVMDRMPSTTLAEIDAARRISPGYAGVAGYGLEASSVRRALELGVIDSSFARFFRSWEAVPTLNEATSVLATRRRADVVVVEDPQRPSRSAPRAGPPDRVTLAHNGFNRFRFEIDAHGEGYLTVSFPWFEGFAATVDGAPTPVRRANAYQVAVPVPEGAHAVELRYRSPATAAGILVALAVAVALAGWVAFRVTARGIARGAAIAAAVAAAWVAWTAWQVRVREGSNLGTPYTWQSDRLPSADDVAFGRRTAMSSQDDAHDDATRYYAGRGVDGSSYGPGFVTSGQERDPWWQVDLARPIRLRGMTLHGLAATIGTSVAPLMVLVSQDGVAFEQALVIDGRAKGDPEPLSVALEGTAQFVRLKTLGTTVLSAREVEIFGQSSP